MAVNEQRKRAMARKVIAACGGDVRGKTIAVLGLTFKPNTDDMRDAPSLAHRSPALQDAGAKVRAYDPEGMEQAKRAARRRATMPPMPMLRSTGRTRSCIVTEWDAFRALDLDRREGELLRPPIVVDLRNIYRPRRWPSTGSSTAAWGAAAPETAARQWDECGAARQRKHRRHGCRRVCRLSFEPAAARLRSPSSAGSTISTITTIRA